LERGFFEWGTKGGGDQSPVCGKWMRVVRSMNPGFRRIFAGKSGGEKPVSQGGLEIVHLVEELRISCWGGGREGGGSGEEGKEGLRVFPCEGNAKGQSPCSVGKRTGYLRKGVYKGKRGRSLVKLPAVKARGGITPIRKNNWGGFWGIPLVVIRSKNYEGGKT